MRKQLLAVAALLVILLAPASAADLKANPKAVKLAKTYHFAADPHSRDGSLGFKPESDPNKRSLTPLPKGHEYELPDNQAAARLRSARAPEQLEAAKAAAQQGSR